MISRTFYAASTDSIPRSLLNRTENSLAARIDELASLRFSLMLAARYADSENQKVGHRDELRARLKVLRRQYSEKIDEIAIGLSATDTMRVLEQVEQNVVIPRGIQLSIESLEEEIDPGI